MEPAKHSAARTTRRRRARCRAEPSTTLAELRVVKGPHQSVLGQPVRVAGYLGREVAKPVMLAASDHVRLAAVDGLREEEGFGGLVDLVAVLVHGRNRSAGARPAHLHCDAARRLFRVASVSHVLYFPDTGSPRGSRMMWMRPIRSPFISPPLLQVLSGTPLPKDHPQAAGPAPVPPLPPCLRPEDPKSAERPRSSASALKTLRIHSMGRPRAHSRSEHHVFALDEMRGPTRDASLLLIRSTPSATNSGRGGDVPRSTPGPACDEQDDSLVAVCNHATTSGEIVPRVLSSICTVVSNISAATLTPRVTR